MPSRAYTSFLRAPSQVEAAEKYGKCQCPLGLIPHFYQEVVDSIDEISLVSMPSRAYTSFLRVVYEILCICRNCVNALSGLYLISTWKRILHKYIGDIVSMPSRAYTSFLRYPFKNLGFMRFSEHVFAGIYQNILTTAVFRAC